MKTGDVIVIDEASLLELLGDRPILSDVRQGKATAKRLIEDDGEPLGPQLVLRVEKVGRAKPRMPAFDCDFEGDED